MIIITWPLDLVGGSIISRQGFLLSSPTLLADLSLLLPSIMISPSIQQPKQQQQQPKLINIPLTFLPRGGCLAIKISINNNNNNENNDCRLFTYSAIVDTGSPFLTAPRRSIVMDNTYSLLNNALRRRRQYPDTQEQYGESISTMQWRSVSNIQVLTSDYEYPLLQQDMILGLPDDDNDDDMGRISYFCGLLLKDDQRPTVLQQWGYTSFVLDYGRRLLTLYSSQHQQQQPQQSTTTIHESNNDDNNNSMKLFDFSPFGDNIHHYGVQCQSITIEIATAAASSSSSSSKTVQSRTETFTMSSFQRPVVAVIDSGLTGCIFSDSLQDELLSSKINTLSDVTGLHVTLPLLSSGKFLTLSSNPIYWFLTSFKLPWFHDNNNKHDDNKNHPHVIALGATFLAPNSRISIDPMQGKAKIEKTTCI